MNDFDRLLEADKRVERRLPWLELVVLLVVSAFILWRLTWYIACASC